MKILGIQIGKKADAQVQAAVRPAKFIETVRTNTQRTLADMQNWKTALEWAEQRTNPNREYLQLQYNNIIQDAQVYAAYTQRVQAVMAKDIELLNPDGTPNEDQIAAFKMPWFENTLRHILDSRAYGFSLLQYPALDISGYPQAPILIPRTNVRPELGYVGEYAGSQNGTRWDDRPYDTWCLPIGPVTEFGYLHKIGASAIWKKHAQGTWAAFLQIYGLPMRVAKTEITDVEAMNNAKQMLANMGKSAWAVLGKDDTLDYLQGSSASTDAFENYSRYSDEQIAKVILGQTMTIDNGSSQSQATVHMDVLKSIIAADARFVENVVNFDLLPRMIRMGCPVDNLRFKFSTAESVDLATKFTWVSGLLPYVDVNPEYITEEFGIPVTAKAVQGVAMQVGKSKGKAQ